MPVPEQDPTSTHAGNGITTTFPFGFLLASPSDMTVVVDGVEKSVSTDYTITGLGNEAGGSIAFAAAPSLGARVLLMRTVVLERLTDYQYAGDFQSPTVNLDFDRLWMAIQDAARSLRNAIKLPPGDNGITVLPEASERAGLVIGFDSAGNLALYLPGSGLANASHQANVLAYGADPTGVIDSTGAFNRAYATGKQVIVPAGTYITGQVIPPSKSSLSGVGMRSVIKPIPGFQTNAFWVTPSGSSDIEICDVSFNLPPSTFPNTVAIYAQAGARHRFHDILMPGGGNIGVQLVDNVDTIVERVSVLSVQSFSIQSVGTASRRNLVSECYSGTTVSGHGIQMVNGKDHRVVNSVSDGANGFGINFFRVVGGEMSGNRSGNSMAEGVQATDCSYVSIERNRVIWDKDPSPSTDFGISVAAQTPGWTVIGIKVRGNVVSGNYSSGIALASTNFGPNNDAAVVGPGLPVQYCDVSDNTIVNTCRGGGLVTNGRACGVVLYGSECQHNSVQNNVIVNTEGKMIFGVAEADVDNAFGTPSNNKIANNNVTGALTAKVSKSGSTVESLSTGAIAYGSTVSAAGGALANAVVQQAFYYELETRIDVFVQIRITSNGTGAGSLNFTLPRSAQFGSGTGREAIQGKPLSVICSGPTASIRNFDGSYPGFDGAILEVTLSFFR